jgi:predicted NBD/HSP70 family sugar kinase
MVGHPLHTYRDETAALLTRAPRGPAVMAELADLARRTVASSPIPAAHPVAVGVAISGLVDAAHGLCHVCANIPGWRDLPIGTGLATLLGVEVRVDDCACAQALAEERCGVARGARDFLFVNVGIGIGAALYIDGRLYHGPGGLAGELGHITVDEDGPACGCGNRGCAEALVGAPAIVRRARELLATHTYGSLITADVDGDSAPLRVEHLAASAAAGDKLAFRVLNEAGEHLGVAIAAALNLLGSPLVVLGGGVVGAGEPFLGAVQRTVRLRALPPVARQARIVPSVLDDHAAALGAGLAALDHYLSRVV